MHIILLIHFLCGFCTVNLTKIHNIDVLMYIIKKRKNAPTSCLLCHKSMIGIDTFGVTHMDNIKCTALAGGSLLINAINLIKKKQFG